MTAADDNRQPSAPDKRKRRLVVVGGGAAGFFCAVNAARMDPALQVTIVEKSNKVLSKVRVSGGGRCNVTHACFDISALVQHYPRGQHFVKKAFYRFNPADTIRWFEERGVQLKTEADGRMFPVTDDSATIVDCLLREANQYGVELLLHAEVRNITTTGNGFILEAGNRQLHGGYLCIACGGFPKTQQFDWLRQTGHTIAAPVPSLFTFNMPGNAITALMGVSVAQATVKVKSTKLQETGPLLITHWGLSGPAVLKLSAWGARELAQLKYTFMISVNWLTGFHENSLREEWHALRQQYAAQKIGSRNPFGLPSRLWLYLLEICTINAELRWADVPAALQNRLVKTLTSQEFEVTGKTTFKDEFVTCGGINLNEIDAQTMQSKLVPGLYFAGEIMDVDGITGGFNFQHAWTSGWIAASAIASGS